MAYHTIPATKPGNPPPKVEKRTADSRVLQIDCTPLLADKELVHGKIKASNTALKITEIKARSGKFVRFRVEGGPTDIPHSEYTVVFMVNTSNGNEISVPVIFKVYST